MNLNFHRRQQLEQSIQYCWQQIFEGGIVYSRIPPRKPATHKKYVTVLLHCMADTIFSSQNNFGTTVYVSHRHLFFLLFTGCDVMKSCTLHPTFFIYQRLSYCFILQIDLCVRIL